MTPLSVRDALERPVPPAREPAQAVASIPTGSWGLDGILSTHGWPAGQVSLICGDAMVGKSTLLYHTVAQAQHLGLTVALMDLHDHFSPAYVARLGVSLPDLLIFGKHSLSLLNECPADVLAIDGISDQYTANDVSFMASGPAGCGAWYPVPPRRTIIAVTQVAYRMRSGRLAHLGEVIVPDIPHLAASVRLSAAGTAPGGIRVEAAVTEDSYAPPGGDFPSARFTIRYGRGIDPFDELLELGLQSGAVRKAGSWYDFDGWAAAGTAVQGREAARDLLSRLPGACTHIMNVIRASNGVIPPADVK